MNEIENVQDRDGFGKTPLMNKMLNEIFKVTADLFIGRCCQHLKSDPFDQFVQKFFDPFGLLLGRKAIHDLNQSR